MKRSRGCNWTMCSIGSKTGLSFFAFIGQRFAARAHLLNLMGGLWQPKSPGELPGNDRRYLAKTRAKSRLFFRRVHSFLGHHASRTLKLDWEFPAVFHKEKSGGPAHGEAISRLALASFGNIIRDRFSAAMKQRCHKLGNVALSLQTDINSEWTSRWALDEQTRMVHRRRSVRSCCPRTEKTIVFVNHSLVERFFWLTGSPNHRLHWPGTIKRNQIEIDEPPIRGQFGFSSPRQIQPIAHHLYSCCNDEIPQKRVEREASSPNWGPVIMGQPGPCKDCSKFTFFAAIFGFGMASHPRGYVSSKFFCLNCRFWHRAFVKVDHIGETGFTTFRYTL